MIDILVDLQDEKIQKVFLEQILNCLQLYLNTFRVRHGFILVHGEKVCTTHMGLDPEQPNFAWSFESIVPEKWNSHREFKSEIRVLF